MGDGMAILFSAPLAQPDHQQRALACALEIRRFTRKHAAAQHTAGIALGPTRIGVHSGDVVAGNFGGSTLFDYRALGDAVNVAARIEGVNRYFGTELCVSQAIRDANPDTPMRPVGNVLLKGKEQPLRLYEPCETQPDAQYEAAHKLLSEDEEDALGAFERLDIQRQDDALVRYQLDRLRSGQRGELIVMTDK
jgi:adenylate cyclase